jgi:hypothetical protein
MGRMKMLGSVVILRFAAASDVATSHTHSQMHPRIPELQTLLADLRSWGKDLYKIAVTAFFFVKATTRNMFAN